MNEDEMSRNDLTEATVILSKTFSVKPFEEFNRFHRARRPPARIDDHPETAEDNLFFQFYRCTMKQVLSLGQTLSTFHYTLLDKCRALLSVVERGWPNALDFSLDLELNILRMYYLMNNPFMECFVHYLMNSNCACVRSTTLDNFALDQTSLNKLQSSRLHAARWPNALDISLNMHVERCIVKSRERLARALDILIIEFSDNLEACLKKIQLRTVLMPTLAIPTN